MDDKGSVHVPLRRRVSAFATGIASAAAVILVAIVTQQLPRDAEEAALKGPGGPANHFELTVLKKVTNNSAEPIAGPIPKDSRLTLRIQGASPGEKAVVFFQSPNDKPKLFSATLSVGEDQGILLDSTASPAEIFSDEFEGKVRFCVAAARSTESLEAMKTMLPDLWALMPKSQCSEVTFQ